MPGGFTGSRLALLSPPQGLTRAQAIARYNLVFEAKFNGDGNDAIGSSNLTNNNSATFTTGKQGQATQLVAASSQYWSVADNAAIRVGSVDFWGTCFFQLTTKASNQGIISKYNTGANKREYELLYGSVSDRMLLVVSSDGTSGTEIVLTANTFGAPSTGAWLFAMFYYDFANSVIGLSINGGPFDTTAFSGGIFTSNGQMTIGARSTPTNFFNGLVDIPILGKSPPLGIAALKTEIRDYCFASGNGREI